MSSVVEMVLMVQKCSHKDLNRPTVSVLAQIRVKPITLITWS